MKWFDRVIPMKSVDAPFAMYLDRDMDELDDCFATDIKPRKYEGVDLQVTSRTTGSFVCMPRRNKFGLCLTDINNFLMVQLGVYTKRKVHLQLKPGAEAVHCKPYPVPRSQSEVFKDELNALCDDGVLGTLWCVRTCVSDLSYCEKGWSGTMDL